MTIRISGIAFAGTPFERPLTDADVVGGLTRVTDANGFYNFNPVPPGLYSLTQVDQPAGFLDGQEENADPNDPRTTIVGNDQFTNIVLAPAPIRGPFNFGEILPSSIAGNVYVDANGNSVQDPGEVGLPNVNVTLTGTDDRGNPVNITIPTDAAGNFRFSGIATGDLQHHRDAANRLQPRGDKHRQRWWANRRNRHHWSDHLGTRQQRNGLPLR